MCGGTSTAVTSRNPAARDGAAGVLEGEPGSGTASQQGLLSLPCSSGPQRGQQRPLCPVERRDRSAGERPWRMSQLRPAPPHVCALLGGVGEFIRSLGDGDKSGQGVPGLPGTWQSQTELEPHPPLPPEKRDQGTQWPTCRHQLAPASGASSRKPPRLIHELPPSLVAPSALPGR